MATLTTPATSTATTVLTLYDSFNARDFDRSASVVTDDAVMTNVPLRLDYHGGPGIRQYQMEWATAFPDSRVEVKSVTVDGDRAVVEFIGRGTHLGPLAGPAGAIPPTGRRIEIEFCDVFELIGGRIARGRGYFDAATMMGQLGLLPPAPDTSLDTLARRWFEAMSTGNLDIAYEVFAADYVLHFPGVPLGPTGPEVIRAVVGSFREGFPDLVITVDDTVTSGETVVVRWTAQGTNLGPIMGRASTGRVARWTGISYLRVRNGRVVEDWVETDLAGMMQQLG